MTVIKFDNVSKKYKLYSKGGLYLRDRITHALKRLVPSNGRQAQLNAPAPASGALTLGTEHALEKDFWALRNCTFDIKKGESVAFIGRNGAGKSTILKLLAGVTKPSSGSVSVEGRVAAMIEVGAGFHPELTGRENVYLNGSILGMKKTQIDERFDSIISFAELEDFVDTPVKHYSSGMYVRLGFAIAAHTDPDIYLIDEVLAVGDEAFQKKCLDTLTAHRDAGKSLILVTHSLDKLEDVCNRIIYINHGEIAFDGKPVEAIEKYRNDLRRNIVTIDQPADLGEEAQILNVTFRDRKGEQKLSFKTGEDLLIHVDYDAFKPLKDAVIAIGIWRTTELMVAAVKSDAIETIDGRGSIVCTIEAFPLSPGSYWISIALRNFDETKTYDYHYQRYRLTIKKVEGEHIAGLVSLQTKWSFEPLPSNPHRSGVPKKASSSG